MYHNHQVIMDAHIYTFLACKRHHQTSRPMPGISNPTSSKTTPVPKGLQCLHKNGHRPPCGNRFFRTSDTRIVLQGFHAARRMMLTVPGIPFVACIFHGFQGCLTELNLVFVLEYLQCKPRRSVPGNVTVHEPRPWIVCLECDDEITSSGQKGNISEADFSD